MKYHRVGRRILPCFVITACIAILPRIANAAGFSSGVAAGDVTDTSVVLWTRADVAGAIRFSVAEDRDFVSVIRSGTVSADAANDLTVKVDIGELQPATDYFYRFSREDDPASVSAVGRFRTAPAPNSAAGFRFLFSGDSNYLFAPLTLMGHAALEDASFFVWFGDTIYADVPSGGLGAASTLDEYRAKYLQIRSDAGVQALLARMAVWTGGDDHEVRNDYAGLDPTLSTDQIDAGYQAFFESMPIRPQNVPSDTFRTYRRWSYGSSAEFFMLDERQYRDPSAAAECGDNPDPLGFALGVFTRDRACEDLLGVPRTMLGREQFDWLTSGLSASTAAVKFVINNVPLTHIAVFPYDRWDGYDAERRELLEYIDTHQITGVVFLTTDTHANVHNPDVTRYFRAYRKDYQLDNHIAIPEFIVGPIATNTLHSELISFAGSTANLPQTPFFTGLLNSLEQNLIERLRCINGLAFVDDDRFAYAVVDVAADGQVNVTYRGLKPDDAADPNSEIETLYNASPTSPPPLPVPCFFPVLVIGWIAYGLHCVRSSRLQLRISTDRHCSQSSGTYAPPPAVN